MGCLKISKEHLFCHEKAESAKLSKSGCQSEEESSIVSGSLDVNGAEEVVKSVEHGSLETSDTQVRVLLRTS